MTPAPTAGRGRDPGWVLPGLLALPSVVLAALVALAWPPLLALERAVTGWAVGLAVANPELARAGLLVEHVTEPAVWWAVASLVALRAVLRGSAHHVRVVTVTVLVAGLASPTAKSLVGRARPALEGAVTTASGGAYPSGHVLAAVVVGGCGCLVGARLLRPGPPRALLWSAWACLVLVVAFDRLLVGAHWLSDTVGSVSLGCALLAVTAARLRVSGSAAPDRCSTRTSASRPGSPAGRHPAPGTPRSGGSRDGRPPSRGNPRHHGERP
ncbi:undecaprenyl-diphosphatase [Kineococcus xinjiangensis]|uniref:Undecaprenyl-diphosphatase n=1 Tax=Kineococcus xinjiangensis TaxID=512762 RepID=A0A2S6IP90_9ACTN|nr:phosphatase PAP2 family protein [Kineococcus xinjiangensis]PPK95985.1 undecaprenyl-diphosphatase [Kineococcus xinjiangensis]